MELIERESIGKALSLAWVELPKYLRKMWWLTVLTIAVAVYVDWKISMSLAYAVYVMGAGIPAMIYFSKPRAGASAADIALLGLLFTTLTLLVAGAAISNIGPATSGGRYPMSIALTFVVNWLALKLSAGIPMYLMQPKSSVALACAASWRFVRAETWWRVLVVNVAGNLPYVGLHAIAYAERGTLVRGGAYFAAVVVVQTFAVAGRAWSSLATVALVSTAPVLAASNLEIQ
jgi:hypothetical protein